MYIGTRIKALRQAQKMKLIELAKESGVQIATLSRIEHNKMTGTLDSHVRIARALGVDVTDLMTDIEREPTETLEVAQGAIDIFKHNEKMSYEILAKKLSSKKMMPMLIRIEGGGTTHPEENRPGTQKWIYVLEGKIDIYVANQKTTVSRHTSLYFNADKPHHYENSSKSPVRMLCVATPVIY